MNEMDEVLVVMAGQSDPNPRQGHWGDVGINFGLKTKK